MSGNWGGKREGSGRKRTGRTTKSITLTLPEEEATELKYRADLAHLTVSKFIIKYLDLEYLSYKKDK